MKIVLSNLGVIIPMLVAAFVLFIIIVGSLRKIGPTQVGLVIKTIGAKLPGDNAIAFNGEAGYQAELLMPGLHFKLLGLFRVIKHPLPQIPTGEIGVVIAQIGKSLPAGAKSGIYKPEFGDFTNLRAFVDGGGEKGVQRPVLAPGSVLPIHPIAFLVVTASRVYGTALSSELASKSRDGELTPAVFNLQPDQLRVVQVQPTLESGDDEENAIRVDTVGVVTTLEGKPLSSGSIASRLGGFEDIRSLEQSQGETQTAATGVTEGEQPTDEVDPTDATDAQAIELLLGDKNGQHNNYQNFQAFLDAGGEMGLQHDVLRYGAYNLNPFLVRVEIVPMLVVNQGETAVIKAYVGLPTQDTSGKNFKFGMLVRPGHRGLWRQPLRTGKYAINPRIYQAEKVPTAILNLNWAKATSAAHDLDAHLTPIEAKSKEGFVSTIDLQVLIHVPDTKAPKVISMVGTMKNLVNEVLQAAVGNLFRDKLGAMEAVKFIETRQTVQEEAFSHIQEKLAEYDVETRGVYIQNVIYPPELVEVLKAREIANQNVQTYTKEAEAEEQRIEREKQKGTADKQAALASSAVGITIATNDAEARKAEADGEATYIQRTGQAKGAEVEAVGLANAKAYAKQVEALGQMPTAMVNVFRVLAESKTPFMPSILVTGGGNGGGSSEGLMAAVLGMLQNASKLAPTTTDNTKSTESAAPAPPEAASELASAPLVTEPVAGSETSGDRPADD